jgi:predicted nucleic acid-binding protein
VPSALVDANALIGYLDPTDPLHDRSVEGLSAAIGDLVTTWPAVTEAAHILGHRDWLFQEALLTMIGDGELLIAPLTDADAPRVKALMSKYRDRPMDLADATLLRVAERDGIETIVTLDRDFRVYRAAGIGALKILPKP